mmetsp:Transcript_26252/g.44796  ORF Transcript_26252/g.44796 Transcript_26252/m.44796 type:complete len:898 (+) Transcript_26252:41-2734(+)
MSVKFFNPAKKGEIHEMEQDLNSSKIEKQKNALKRIIGAMTIGKDVSMLFPHVVKCINTSDLELKKLVYLYVMNYAKSQPDLVILSVNTFVQDATKSPNPLIRALAIRTMGCIRLQKIAEYLYTPLRTALKDADPYVRKTAAICVAKLFDISPETVESQGFIQILHDCLTDSNPMVVSNALAALTEIDEINGGGIFTVTAANLSKLLAALDESTEWGQTVILNALSKYVPRDSREAENIADRITSRLQHSNSAVVLGAIRLLMCYLDHIQSVEITRTLSKKMSAPLITLLSKEPEIQYVALRNMSLILQKRPTILQHEMKVFFCKYNDPIYVKMEKLEIIIMLANAKNIDQVLLEFKEYATAADIEFVRRAIRAIGRCAIKLESSAEKCIHVLLELIENGFNPVVQESIIVIKDIFRKYPNRYESIIGKLCQNLDTLDEPEAKAAMIWIIGEYAKKIENAGPLLKGFLENFLDEPVQVQLQLLTATVKLFLHRPKNSKSMLVNVLNLATKECDDPDLRDRGFIYWRLLSDGPQAAAGVVLTEKPQIDDDTSRFDPEILDDLVSEISNVAAVYHKPAETFIKFRRAGAHLKKKRQTASAQKESEPDDIPIETLTIDLEKTPVPTPSVDLLGIGEPQQPRAQSPPSSNSPIDNVQQPSSNTSSDSEEKTQAKLVLQPENGDGMAVAVGYVKAGGQLFMEISIANRSQAPLSGFALQLNVNIVGLKAGALSIPNPIAPGSSTVARVPLTMSLPDPNTPPSPNLQVALKNNIKIYYFQDLIPFKFVFDTAGELEKATFLSMWKSLPDSCESSRNIPAVRTKDAQAIQQFLGQNNIFPIACRPLADKTVLYMSASVQNNPVLVELTFPSSAQSCNCVTKTRDSQAAMISQNVLGTLLAAPRQ